MKGLWGWLLEGRDWSLHGQCTSTDVYGIGSLVWLILLVLLGLTVNALELLKDREVRSPQEVLVQGPELKREILSATTLKGQNVVNHGARHDLAPDQMSHK